MILDRSLMMGWSEELRKPWKGCLCLCFFVCVCVCLCVCYQATDHSFRPSNLIFWKYVLWDYGKKWIFRFFEIFIFDVLGPFSFFLLCLCIGHKSPHWTYKHNFWYVGSLWHSKSKKNVLKIFFFDDLKAILKMQKDNVIEFLTYCT